MSDRTFYVTTPIYYVNAEPHLGTAYTTIAADALARYRRMTGNDVMFLTGLDEHGQKIAQAAEENGMDPQAWVDAIAPKFKAAWEMLGVSYDDFVRTTESRHKRGVQAFWTSLHDRGYLYKGHYDGWYCVPDETFWTEDQLEDGKCPQCAREVEFIREDNWFFKLSEFQQPLLDFYEAHPDFIQPETRRNEVLSFVKQGLKDLSISRTNFTWGVPLPFAENHVTYVWIDALLNYITALGYGSDDPAEQARFERYWPAQYHFVGKDIIRFHCVIWPAMLLAAGVEPPKSVFAHGFLLTKGEKMSKSKGNAQTPASLVERFGVDAYRYYFLRDVAFGQDGSISMESMVQRYNGDLANDWGNLCSRLFNMVGKYFDGLVPEVPGNEADTDEDMTLKAIAGTLPEKYEDSMSRLEYMTALETTWDLIKEVNRYIENQAPWNLAKTEETAGRLAAVIYNALEAVRIAALFTAPAMPGTSAEVWTRLGLGDITGVTDIAAAAVWGQLPTGSAVTKGDPLYPRIYEDK
ncbi:MAG: methionine--tRNA ligase [Coriobacteriia bacterium]|nr:methionine--tRNA ligase [Coriobacteriia bacterium]MBN2823194.1 methionine--tRNA ligase [Coriobacteriia bacterium]